MIKGRGFYILLVLAFSAPSVWAQIPQSQVIFSYLGFINESARGNQGLREADALLMENKLTGYLLEIARQENYSIINAPVNRLLLDLKNSGKDERFREALSDYASGLVANGVIVFRLSGSVNNGWRFVASLYASPSAELVAQNVESGQTFDLVLEKTVVAVYGLFGLSVPGASSRLAQESTTTIGMGSFIRVQSLQIRDLGGIWQGDYGLVRIEIHPDGSGLAWLSETENMKIKVLLNDQTIIIQQDEPNSPKLYLSVFPYGIASQIVRLARPMSWEFRLTQERDRLIGTKETSYFYIEQGKIVQVDNTYSRDAVWVRMP